MEIRAPSSTFVLHEARHPAVPIDSHPISGHTPRSIEVGKFLGNSAPERGKYLILRTNLALYPYSPGHCDALRRN